MCVGEFELYIYDYFLLMNLFLFAFLMRTNFDYCINKLKDAGYNPGKLHIQNTYGTLNYSNLRYDYVHIRIGMYGIFNNISHKNNSKIPINLKPVLSLLQSLHWHDNHLQ